MPLASGDYYQRRLPGVPVSVLLLADGPLARKFSAPQFAMDGGVTGAALSFRRSGATGFRRRRAACGNQRGCGRRIVAALGFVGLNSVDFLADADGFHLLEMNPRPGATLDIFMDRDGAIFAAHLAACRGHLPRQPLVFTKAAATAIAYAPRELASMPHLAWPDWCKDQQRPGTCLRAGDPVCTAFGRGRHLRCRPCARR